MMGFFVFFDHLMIVPSLYNPRSLESSFNGRDIIFMALFLLRSQSKGTRGIPKKQATNIENHANHANAIIYI